MEFSKKYEKKCESKDSSAKVCRLCMSKNARVPIFPDLGVSDLKSNGSPPLVCKIMSCLNVQVKKDDGLPTHICNECSSKVESTYDFLRLCEMSDSFLRQYLDFGLQVSWYFRYSELLRLLNQTEEEEDLGDND